MRLLTFTVLVFVLNSCKAQSDKSLIKNWYSYPVPTNLDTLNKLGFSNDDWIIHSEKGVIYVSSDRTYKPKSQLPFQINPKLLLRGRQSVVKVNDGYLIGFNRGEWGGELYWFSNDGTKSYKISDDEIVDFSERDGKVFAIQGLAHLNFSKGSFMQIEQQNAKWIVNGNITLPSAPKAIGVDKENNFIIVTSKSLLKIDNKLSIQVLIDKGIWYHGLYPSSMVINGDDAFIGMRKGIFKYNLRTGEQSWLLRE